MLPDAAEGLRTKQQLSSEQLELELQHSLHCRVVLRTQEKQGLGTFMLAGLVSNRPMK
jgi:hypothetical protein